MTDPAAEPLPGPVPSIEDEALADGQDPAIVDEGAVTADAAVEPVAEPDAAATPDAAVVAEVTPEPVTEDPAGPNT